jgi:hypothetical protein
MLFTSLPGKAKYHLLYWLLFVCVLLEVLCNTFWIAPPNPHGGVTEYMVAHRQLVSCIYFLAGILTGIIFASGVEVPQVKYNRYLSWGIRLIVLIILSVAAVQFCLAAKNIFAATPLDYHFADMLPVIKIMNERFLNHERVYAVIPEIWNGTGSVMTAENILQTGGKTPASTLSAGRSSSRAAASPAPRPWWCRTTCSSKTASSIAGRWACRRCPSMRPRSRPRWAC